MKPALVQHIRKNLANYLETRYSSRKELSRRLNQWYSAARVPAEGALVAAVFRDTGCSEAHFTRSTGPEMINSEAFDRIIRLKHFVYEEYLRPGRRLVVLCGAEHRYILRDLLQADPAVRLREYYEVSR